MEKNVITFILPNFNQLFYLKNLINWIEWMHPDREQYPIYVLDNNSSYEPLIKYYDYLATTGVKIFAFKENNFVGNLKTFIDSELVSDYYCIIDPDCLPHPNTPRNYLEQFKNLIDSGYHHVGFNLITDDLPEWLHEREMIIGNEKELLKNVATSYQGHIGYKAPIDTTFALYTKKNGGWSSPMNARNWGNSIRLFDCFHYGWYIDGDNLHPEMEHYFKTAKYRVPGQPSAGSNNSRPKRFINE